MGKHVNTQLFYRLFFTGQTVQVITDEQMQRDIIKSMHEGLGDTLESTSMGGHAGQNKTRDKITARYFWPKITEQVAQYISACPACQKAKFISLQKVFILGIYSDYSVDLFYYAIVLVTDPWMLYWLLKV